MSKSGTVSTKLNPGTIFSGVAHKLYHLLKIEWPALLRMRNDRCESRRGLLRESARLRRGLYVCEGLRMWRHWSEPLPNHLRHTKAKGNYIRGRSLSAKLSYLIRQVMDPLLPMPYYHCNSGSGQGFSIYIGRRGGKEAIFLDPSSGRAARAGGTDRFSKKYVDLRLRYSTHLSAPKFQVTEEGYFLLEEFIDGQHIEELHPEDQVQVAKMLFRGYTSLVSEEKEGSSETFVEEALKTAQQSQIPKSFLRHLASVKLDQVASSWPLCPSQCDLHSKNILVVGTNPVVIDFGPAKLRLIPFFADLMEFFGRSENELLKSFHAGMFDTDLATLCAAAKVDYPGKKEAREHFVLAYTLLRPLIRSRGKPSKQNYDKLSTEYWETHEAFLEPPWR